MLPRFACIALFATTVALSGSARADGAPPANERPDWRPFGAASGVAGLMFIAGAVAFESAANSDFEAVDAAMRDGLAIDDDRKFRGEEREHTAIVLGVVGVTAVVGGAVAYFLGKPNRPTSAQAMRVQPFVAPTAGHGQSAGLSLRATF